MNLLAPLFGAYNALVAAFATGLYLSWKRTCPFRIGWALMLANCISGVFQVTVLRRDPDGVPLTKRGIGHLVGAGISSLSTVIASLALSFAFRNDRFWQPLYGFSLGSGIAIVMTGLLAGVGAATRSRFMGLLERHPEGTRIGIFLQWVVVLSSFVLLRRPKV